MVSPSVFSRSPFVAIWETTRALACAHCRAGARPRRDPAELTTQEGKALLDRIAALGDPPPLVVLTGGDPPRAATDGNDFVFVDHVGTSSPGCAYRPARGGAQT